VSAVSGAISGLGRLYQQFWSRGAAASVVAIRTFRTWAEKHRRQKLIKMAKEEK